MYRKEIVYDRETRDYAKYLDGELVGFARTYHDAEIELDRLVYELLSEHTPERAAALIHEELAQEGRHEQAAKDQGAVWVTGECWEEAGAPTQEELREWAKEDESPEAYRPDPGAAIVRQWARDPDTFFSVLGQLEPAEIAVLAEAAATFHRRHGSDLDTDRQLLAWKRGAIKALPEHQHASYLLDVMDEQYNKTHVIKK